ncbi:MAG: RnfABCDGE type electron transport complex subunit G [Candidatus Latescibacteria bacterium]|nr:RnfABCDGE type electron transport complex subunit G [Candidatus Latescibacterota bacterium]
MLDILKLGSILTLYSLLAGTALAFVNITSSPRIEQNRLEAEKSAREEVLPGMAGGFVERADGDGFRYWIGYRDARKSSPEGYLFISRAEGYSSTIAVMVGVDTAGVVTGAKVISQRETPGLGARIGEVRHGESDPWFMRQFIGKTIADNDFRVIKDGGGIEAITGATISSRAVTKAIRDGLSTLSEIIGGSS